MTSALTTQAPRQLKGSTSDNSNLTRRVADLEKENARLVKELDYWISAHAEQVYRKNLYEDRCKKLKARYQQLNNSRPSSKTIAQATAEYQLTGTGIQS